MPRAGKEFEELVARIEKILAPLGAVVKSPDYIIDNVTGERREVDASIRYAANGTEGLITIECRDYKKVRQDSRWIEQLNTKRTDLGATKTIAVSSTGFSNSATIKARHHGIELRQMSTITDAEIAKQWLSGFGVYIVFCEFRLIRLSLAGKDGVNIPFKELAPSIVEGFDNCPERTGFLAMRGVNRLLAADDLFNAKVNPGVWLSHEGELPVTVVAESKGDDLSVDTIGGVRTVSRLSATYTVVRRQVPSTVNAASRYGSTDEALMDRVQATADLGDTVVETDFGSSD